MDEGQSECGRTGRGQTIQLLVLFSDFLLRGLDALVGCDVHLDDGEGGGYAQLAQLRDGFFAFGGVAHAEEEVV